MIYYFTSEFRLFILYDPVSCNERKACYEPELERVLSLEVGGSRGLKGNFFEASLYSRDAQLLSFRGLRIIRYGGTYIYVKTFFVALFCVLFSKFVLRTLPSPT
jgi:hypothetical protein